MLSGHRAQAAVAFAICVSIVLLVRAPGAAAYNVLSIVGLLAVTVKAPKEAGKLAFRLFRQPMALSAALSLGAYVLPLFWTRTTGSSTALSGVALGLIGLAATALPFAYAGLTATGEGWKNWGRALSISALAASALHLLGRVGIDLYQVLTVRGLAFPPGGPGDIGSRNTLAGTLALTATVGLFLGAEAESRGWRLVRRVAYGLAAIVIGLLQARTILLLFALVAMAMPVAVRREGASIWRETMGVAAALILAVGLVLGLGSRPAVIKSDLAADEVISVLSSIPGGATFSAGSVFTVSLVEPYHAVTQRLLVRSATEYLWLMASASAGRDAWLDLEADGQPLRRLVPGRDIGRAQGWIRIPLATPWKPGSVHVVRLHPGGELSPSNRYFRLGAAAIDSDAARSTFLVEDWPVAGDLSPDAGVQRGTVLLLSGNSPVLPDWTSVPSPERKALDTSIGDRLVLWRMGVEHALERPWTGWGFHSFARYFNEMARGRPIFYRYANPHSDYVAAFHDGGLLALVPLIVFAALLAAGGVRVLVRGADAGTSALALSTAIVPVVAITQTVFADQRYYALVAVLIGLALAAEKPGPEEAS